MWIWFLSTLPIFDIVTFKSSPNTIAKIIYFTQIFDHSNPLSMQNTCNLSSFKNTLDR